MLISARAFTQAHRPSNRWENGCHSGSVIQLVITPYGQGNAMSFDASKLSSSQSILRTLSARLDAASGIISTVLLLGALLATVIVTLSVVKPNIARKQELVERRDLQQVAVNELKDDCRVTLDRIEAYRDPYYIARFAKEQYHFVPAPPEGSLKR